LECFLAVADELHFGRAAGRLGMAQPPLSQQILRLEQALDVRLFNRTSRMVSLTPAGEQLVINGRELLALRHLSCVNARRAALGEVGHLNIGFGPSTAFGLLPGLISRYRAAYPDVELQVMEGNRETHTQALLDGRLDVAFIRGPCRDPKLTVDRVLIEPIVAVLSSEHPLASEHAEEVSLRSLESETLLIFERYLAPELYDSMVGMCSAAGLNPKLNYAANTWPSISALVTAGFGFALAPASAALLLPQGAVARRVTDASGECELLIVSLRQRSAAADNFMKLCLT
jgi:DNA-binding transcriptional LysR family regulator